MPITIDSYDPLYQQRLFQPPSEKANDRCEVILTFNPKLWNAKRLNKGTVIIDLSTCWRTTCQSQSIYIAQAIIDTFAETGWPVDQLWIGKGFAEGYSGLQAFIVDNNRNPIFMYLENNHRDPFWV